MKIPGLYSALGAALRHGRGVPHHATAVAWRQWLDGAQRRGEFKAAERDWYGLDAWLAEQAGDVPREALIAQVEGHLLQMEIIVRGEPEPWEVTLPEGWSVVKGTDDLWRVRDAHKGVVSLGCSKVDALRGVPDSLPHVFRGTPFYDAYRLPGGEGYREILIRLEAHDGDMSGPLQGRRLGRFGGGHFNEDNVLVHLRVATRQDVTGRRVLFLEEVQSDWHQAGRRRGYGFEVRERQWPGQFEIVNAATGERVEVDGVVAYFDRDQAQAIIDSGQAARQGLGGRIVPDAPFKKTPEWITLAFKQALREAVRGNYDAVAWTTGTMQVERYDLAEKVQSLGWTKRSGGYDLRCMFRSGRDPDERHVSEARLLELVGKEIADRIIAQANDPTVARSAAGHPCGRLDEADLRMDGKGMRTFYDNILPRTVGRYVKSMGGKVGDLSITVPWDDGTREAVVQAVTVTPAMRESVLAGQPMFRRTPVRMTGMSVDQVSAIAREFLDQYAGGLATLSVRVGQTLEDLYGQGATEILGTTAAGAYHPARGIITVAADRMRDRTDVETTLRHELLGHYGLNTFRPEDKRRILDAIVASREAPGMKPLWEAVDRRYADHPLYTRAEEVFALVAEQPERTASAALWQRLLALVHKAMRAAGLAKGQTSRPELEGIVRDIGRGIREGRRPQRTFPARDDTQFQRKDIDFLMARNQEQRLQGMAQTETAAFKRWFGASKIVDVDGGPLVMYHGTKDDFAEFKQHAGSRFDAGWFGNGFYLTASPELSSAYALRERDGSHTTRPANVMPVYVKLENPYRVDLSGMSHKEATCFTDRFGGNGGFEQWLRDHGHDGVIGYRDPAVAGKGAEFWEVVVFHSEQIKSAIGNRGTFDVNDPDIRLKRADPEALNHRLGHTKVVDAVGKPLHVYHGTTVDFDVFASRENGLFFTDDVAAASRYGRPMEACLALENPIVIDAKGTFWNELDTLDSPAMDELRQYGRILVLDHLKAAAEKAGYDGVIVHNVVDNHGAGNQYIAFRSDQVHIVDAHAAFNVDAALDDRDDASHDTSFPLRC